MFGCRIGSQSAIIFKNKLVARQHYELTSCGVIRGDVCGFSGPQWAVTLLRDWVSLLIILVTA